MLRLSHVLMRTTLVWVVGCVVLVCNSGRIDASNPEAGLSLLPNGDFEKADASGEWPDGWGVETPGKAVSWQLENGKHFMRLVSQRPGQLQTLYRSLKLMPGQVGAINATIRYRASGVTAGEKPGQDARAWIAFEDATGRTLDAPTSPLVFAPAADWTEVSAQLVVPASASRWIIVAGLLQAAAGTVDVQQISVQPLGAIEAAALAARQPKSDPLPASWVQNGDFSIPDANGKWPLGWGNANPGMSWETENATHFVRVALLKPGQVLMLDKIIPLQPGVRGVELLIRWRADGVEHGEHEWFDARTIVHFIGPDGQPIPGGGEDIVFTHKPAPTGWKESTKAYVVPEGAVGLQLMSGLFKARAGTVDLAEVRVTPMKDATSELQQITSAAYGVWKGDEDAALDRRVGVEIDAQLARTGDLVPNGRFEQIDKDGKPTDWSKQLNDGIVWQGEKGGHFMHLTSQDAGKVRMLYRMIPLKLGIREIEVTVRYRAAGITKGDHVPGDARVVMHFLNGLRFGHLENGKEVNPQPADIELSSDAKEWTEVRRRYPVPEGATKLQFMPGLWNVSPGGVLDIAELHVVPVPDQTTAPAATSSR